MTFLRREFWPLALLALLALIFFWPVTLGLGWVPRGGGDLVSFLWPTYHYAARALWAGRVPLWNPTLYAGMPFAADNQSGVFYPLNWLAFLLAPQLPYAALEWLVIVQVWLAGAGMYFFLRALLAERRAALFAAIAFMFSEVFITHIGNLNIIAAAAWLPWAMGATHLALTRLSVRWALGAGTALALAALAGHAQTTLMVFGAVGLYAASHTLSVQSESALGFFQRMKRMERIHPINPLHPLTSPAVFTTLKIILLIFLIALGLSAIALLPTIELTAYTGRARLAYAAAAEYSLPWAGLAGLFSPLVFGRGAAFFWGGWPRVEAGYLGVLPWLFLPFALRRERWVWLALGALGLLIALGEHTPIHRLLYDFVPGFAQLRVPARFILLTDFALATLGGLGLHDFLSAPDKHKLMRWAARLTGLMLMGIGFAYLSVDSGFTRPAGMLWGAVCVVGLMTAGVCALRARAPLLIVALLAVDVIGLGAWVEVERHDPTLGFQHSAAIAYLQSQPGPTRIDNASRAWQPDAAAMVGLEDIGGVSNPLGLAAYQTYVGAVGSRGTPLYNFLNVQFVIANKDQPPADDSFVPVFNEDPQVDVYLNTNAMPRVSLVSTAETVASGEAAFAAIHALGFNPATQVVVENGPSFHHLSEGESNLYYLAYQAEAFSVVAVTSAPAYVVFSEVWYPGWRAWVDGVETPIYKANFAFRAVHLPAAGEHVVQLRFAPRTWQVGAAVSVATLVAMVVLAVRESKQ